MSTWRGTAESAAGVNEHGRDPSDPRFIHSSFRRARGDRRRRNNNKLDTDDLRSATRVAHASQQLEGQILPAAIDNPTLADADLARLAFYFGALSLFGLYNAALDGAESEEAVEVARSTLADEFDAFLADHEADLH